MRKKVLPFSLPRYTSIMSSRSHEKSSRAWCFTINNPLNGDFLDIQGAQYSVQGLEKAPTTNTTHIQGYVYWPERRTFAWMKSYMPNAHIEAAKGTPHQNDIYCKKDGNYRCTGALPAGQGARTDLHMLASMIKSGSSLSDVVDMYPTQFIRYSRGISALYEMYESPQMRLDVHVVAIYGPTGRGKTRWAYDRFGVKNVYCLDQTANGTIYFEKYKGQPVLLIDDFKDWIPFRMFLKMLDVYPYVVMIKGRSAYAQWHTVVITSEYSVDQWYDSLPSKIAQIKRRIHEFLDLRNLEDQTSIACSSNALCQASRIISPLSTSSPRTSFDTTSQVSDGPSTSTVAGHAPAEMVVPTN